MDTRPHTSAGIVVRDRLARGKETLVWFTAFSLIIYLGLEGGGYDFVVYAQTGIVVCWIVFLLVATGSLREGIGRDAWIVLGLLLTFAIWTAVSASWSESAGRTSNEIARVLTYLSILMLGVLLQKHGSKRNILNGVVSASAIICAVAVLSGLHPGWFPSNDTAMFFPDVKGRLSYPLNYWNGLAAFAAMGLVLLLWATSSARTLLGSALAAAALPVGALCLYLTLSRGGIAIAVIAIAIFLVLTPRRLQVLATVLVAAAGAAALIALVKNYTDLANGEVSKLASEQGGKVLVALILVSVVAALLQVAVSMTARRLSGRIQFTWTRKRLFLLGGACTVFLLALFIGLSQSGRLTSEWHKFKQTGIPLSGDQSLHSERLVSVSGNGRYQYWQSTVKAADTRPWGGIGSGTWEFWWARHGTFKGSFVRDAHSLYFQTLGELGIIGLILLASFILFVLFAALIRVLRAPKLRQLYAGAISACIAFTVAAGIDWTWQLPVVPAVFMLIVAVVVGRDVVDSPSVSKRRQVITDVSASAITLAAMVVIAIPLAETLYIRHSQAAIKADKPRKALRDVDYAVKLQPYAAAAHVQRALVLERVGRLTEAAREARQATELESTNWRTWLIRSRLAAERGKPVLAIRGYRHARDLNPRSSFFN